MSDPEAETSAPGDVVRRTTAAQGAKAERLRAARARPREATPLNVAVWGLVLLAGLASLAPIVEAISTRMSDQLLLQADETGVTKVLEQPPPVAASADYLETLSELAMDAAPANLAVARQAAERAVALEPSRAQAWARIAYLEYLAAHDVTPRAIEALGKSIEACPLCDADLVRWRFNFVLANWNAVPDALRRKAFEGADMLRWAGGDAEADFLAEMRTKAAAAGIPYDQYRAAVATPVKSWDVQG